MESHDSLDPGSSLWDLVAVQLRLLRLNHRWTCQQVGDVANASRSHVSNWEAGRRRPNQANLVPLDEAWGTAGLLASLAEHAKDGHDRPRVGALLRMAELDHVSLRVLPVSAGWPGVSGSLSLMSTRNVEVAYLESGRMGRLVDRQSEIREFSVSHDKIGALALPEDQSAALIKHMLRLIE